MDKKKYLLLLIIGINLLNPVVSQEENIQKKFTRVNPKICTLTGKLLLENDSIVTDALFTVIDNQSRAFIGNYVPEISTGIFSIPLLKGNRYQIIVENNEFFAFSVEINIPAEADKELSKDIILPDSYRRFFVLYFEKLLFDEIQNDILSKIDGLMTGNSDMKIKLLYGEDSISAILADTTFLKLENLGINAGRVKLRENDFPDADDYMITLQIKHQIVADINRSPESFQKPVDIAEIEEVKEEDEELNNEVKEERITIIQDAEGDPVYTIQLSASKKPLPQGSYQGITDLKVYHGKDGFYRYTSGKFVTMEAAKAYLEDVKKKGYPGAYVKELKSYIEK
ncbi:hypothetical protein ACFLTI_04045 [Bacteroidota bacterium]